MRVCRVVGEVVATVKHPFLSGYKMLIVQPVTEMDAPMDRPLLAVDSIGAGPVERILLNDEGGGAALVLGREGPMRAVIVGKVDSDGFTVGSSLENGS